MPPPPPLARWLAVVRGALADLIAPAACPICEAESGAEGSPICPDCRAELVGAAGLACPRCALPIGPHADLRGGCSACRGRPLGFDAAIALGPYSGPIRDLCLRLKRHRDAWLARWLADALADARAGPLRVWAESDSAGGPVVVPVPLHYRRRLARGYNQAEALADALARRLGLRPARALRRIRGAGRALGLSRADRLARVKGAFAPRGRPDLTGRTVLLVDDVLTTGATAGAAARALKAIGAARVVAVVIARAEGKA